MYFYFNIILKAYSRSDVSYLYVSLFIEFIFVELEFFKCFRDTNV